MQHVQLGTGPVFASRVVFGAMAIGDARRDPSRRSETIRAAIDAGITSIDTAPLYDFGASEELVGRAIRSLRHEVQVFTKVGLRWDDPHGEILFTTRDRHGRTVAVRGNSRPESVRVEVDRSLARLGVDAIDLVFVHLLDRHTPVSETMGALEELVAHGKIRAVGISSDGTPARVLEAQRALSEVPLSAVQLRYSLLDRAHEHGVLAVAREHRIGVVARSALEMGLMAGKLSPSSAFAPDDLRSDLPSFHPDNIRRITSALQRGVEPVATRHGASIAQVVLAWTLAQPGVSAVCVGASWPDQARADAEAVALQLGPEELRSMQCVFERVELDAYAGLGPARRVYTRTRRAAGGVRRRVVRAVSRFTPVPIGGDRTAGLP